LSAIGGGMTYQGLSVLLLLMMVMMIIIGGTATMAAGCLTACMHKRTT
jgi:hypothetical protein